MPVKHLDEHVDATKAGAYCASGTEVSYAAGTLDDVMIHLRAAFSKTRQTS
jgi:hypothetical protein